MNNNGVNSLLDFVSSPIGIIAVLAIVLILAIVIIVMAKTGALKVDIKIKR